MYAEAQDDDVDTLGPAPTNSAFPAESLELQRQDQIQTFLLQSPQLYYQAETSVFTIRRTLDVTGTGRTT